MTYTMLRKLFLLNLHRGLKLNDCQYHRKKKGYAEVVPFSCESRLWNEYFFPFIFELEVQFL